MTNLSTSVAIDMTSFDLADLRDGSNTVTTDAEWRVTGALGFTDYQFGGSGLFFGSNGRPNTGTIANFGFFSHAQPTLTITGNILAKHLSKYVANNNGDGLLSEWFRHDDLLTGSSAADHLLGFRGQDTFDLTSGGEDKADGGSGDDTFLLGASLSVGDQIFGGSGFADTVVIDGSIEFTFGASTLNGVEIIELTHGGDYVLHIAPPGIGPNGLNIDGHKLGAHDNLSVDMTFVADKSLIVSGGNADDVLSGSSGIDVLNGGKGDDVLAGGRGGDTLEGGAGADQYQYTSAPDSLSSDFDAIRQFNQSQGDRIVVDLAFDHVNAAITTGHLDFGTFDADLEAQVDTGSELGRNDAVLFTADTGTMAGQTFLIIDFNNKIGYQTGKDAVILMDGTAGLSTFDDGAFLSV